MEKLIGPGIPGGKGGSSGIGHPSGDGGYQLGVIIFNLEQQNQKLKAMLKKHEFCDDGYRCPECYGTSYDGHYPSCQLAELIKDEV